MLAHDLLGQIPVRIFRVSLGRGSSRPRGVVFTRREAVRVSAIGSFQKQGFDH